MHHKLRTKVQKNTKLISFVMLLIVLPVTVIFLQYEQNLHSRAASLGPLPPTNPVETNDDHLGKISWTKSTDATTVGYKITWGETGNLSKSFFVPSTYTDANFQPLVDGKTYQVQVQAVDKNGNLSTPAGPVAAQTDPTFVNTLRSQMNGFFDDFNDTPVVKATNWFTAYNNASLFSTFFINSDQQHFHMLLENCVGQEGLDCYGDTDRASLNMRALRPFDFTGRTGTIAFDFDWGNADMTAGNQFQNRYQWYLVLSPDEQDITDFDTGPNIQYPLDRFEIHMHSDGVNFARFVNGAQVAGWGEGYGSFNLPANLRRVNVRRHSVVKVSKDTVSLTIDGVNVLTANGVNLDFEKAWILNQQFQYNIPKVGLPYATSHWDNFGFDAPAGYAPDVLHEYTDGNIVKSDRQGFSPGSSSTWTVSIPDPLVGEKAERLFMDAKEADAQATVTVNGASFTFPYIGNIHNVEAFDTREIDLPIGTLHQGNNTVSVRYTGSGSTGLMIQGVHVEVAFPNGSTAPYTPPVDQQRVLPALPVVAPYPGFGSPAPANGSTVSGTIPIDVTADAASASLLAVGHVNAVTQVGVVVDGQVMATYALAAPTVQTDQIVNLDTTRIPNGQHKLSVIAWGMDKNPDGSVGSITRENELLADRDNTPNAYRIIQVNNANGAASMPPNINPTSATVTASPQSFSAGSTITVSWSNIPNPSVSDWVGLYAANQSTPDGNAMNWIFLNNCSQSYSPTIPPASGSCTMTLPSGSPNGIYQLRLYMDEVYNVLAESPYLGVGQIVPTSPPSPTSAVTFTPTLTPSSTPTRTPTPPMTPTRTPTPTSQPTNTPVPTVTPSANTVSITSFAFTPQTLTVPSGTTVTWINNSTVSHTTTSDTGVWDSGILTPGQQFSFTFATPGTYTYHCTIHPTTMTGTIIVTGSTIPGDINGDGQVDVGDLSILADNFGLSGGGIINPNADINHDGKVDVVDLSILADHFGQ